MYLVYIMFGCLNLGYIGPVKSVRREIFDYNYSDWEEKTVDYLVGTTTEAATVSTQATRITAATTVYTTRPPDSFHPVYYEIKASAAKDQSGYVPVMLSILYDSIKKAQPQPLTALLSSLHAEIMTLSSQDKLTVFNPRVNEMLTGMASVMATSDPFYIQNLAEYAKELQRDRTQLHPTVNAIMDEMESIYIDTDIDNIARSLDDIRKFPANKSAVEVAKGFVDSFMMQPLKRIEGSELESVLVKELDGAVDVLAADRIVRKSNDDEYITKVSKYFTITSTETPAIYSIFDKNTTQMESNTDHKTSPTTTQMDTNKYSKTHYTKRNLYNMTSKGTISTNIQNYFPRHIRKRFKIEKKKKDDYDDSNEKNIDSKNKDRKNVKYSTDLNSILQDYINTENEGSGIAIDNKEFEANINLTNEKIINKNILNLNTSQTPHKKIKKSYSKANDKLNKKQIRNKVTKNKRKYNENLYASIVTCYTKFFKRNSNKIKQIQPYVDETSEVKYLRVNRNKTKTRSEGYQKITKHHKSDSSSDIETKLKNSLYKAMELENYLSRI